MTSIYGKGIAPFYAPGSAHASSETVDAQLSSLQSVHHKWGIVAPHHFDFNFGLDVRRNHPKLRSEMLRAVRLTGSGVLRQDGHEDQHFYTGAILVERSPGGLVRAFSPETFLKHFERADGDRLRIADEVPFQTPERKERGSGVVSRRAA